MSSKTAFENGTGVACANDNTEVIAYAKENPGYVVGISSLGDQQSIAPAVTKVTAHYLTGSMMKLRALEKTSSMQIMRQHCLILMVQITEIH